MLQLGHNEIPIGAEDYLNSPDGLQRQTVLVEDWRLPEGWTKHSYQRSSISGKWDAILVRPTKKRFRSKNDVKLYLEEKDEVYNQTFMTSASTKGVLKTLDYLSLLMSIRRN